MNRFILSTVLICMLCCVALNARSKKTPFVPTIENLNTYTFMPSRQDKWLTEDNDIDNQDFINNKDNAIRIRTLIKSVQDNTPLAHTTIRINYTCTQHAAQEPDKSYGKFPIFCGCIKYPNPLAIFDAHQGVSITNEHAITIFSRGYARKANPKVGLPQKGGGIFDGYVRKRDNILHLMPSLVFDYQDERRRFNFCQELDIQCLKTVYDQTVMQNPTARIILSGDCRGALNVLKFTAANPDAANVDALVLVSPFISVEELTAQIGRSYFHTPLMGRFLHQIFKWHFYNYKPERDTLMQDIVAITGKKIFIAHRVNDSLVSDASMYHLAQKLTEYGNDVYLVIIHDTSARHSRLSPLAPFQQTVNAFLKKYDYPHDATLAGQGEALLAQGKSFLKHE